MGLQTQRGPGGVLTQTSMVSLMKSGRVGLVPVHALPTMKVVHQLGRVHPNKMSVPEKSGQSLMSSGGCE